MQKKTVDEIQHLFMKKILNKVGLDSMYLIMIQAILTNPRANITFNGETESYSSKIRNKTKRHTLTSFIQHSIGSTSQSS